MLGALNRLSVRLDEGKPWHKVGGRYDDKRGVREEMGRRARCFPGCPNAAQDDHEHDGGRVERGREGTLLDTRYKEGRVARAPSRSAAEDGYDTDAGDGDDSGGARDEPESSTNHV